MTQPVLLSRSDIDDGKWNRLIFESRQSLVYGLTWYLDIVSPHWEAFVWPSPSDYQVVMPIPVLRKYGFRVVQQPLFCQYLGLFSKSKLQPELINSFVSALVSTFSYISSYHFNTEQTKQIIYAAGSFSKLETAIHHSHFLDLSKSFQHIFENYSKDRKVNVKRANAWNWEEYADKNLNPILEMFRQNHEGRIQGGVNPEAYELLKRLLAKADEVCDMRVAYAGQNGNYCAGIVTMEYNGRTIYIFNAANKEGREGNARSWLLNNYFEASAESDLVFDFESPDIASISGFYESFGAVPTPYVTIHLNDLPTLLKQFQRWRRNRSRSQS